MKGKKFTKVMAIIVSGVFLIGCQAGGNEHDPNSALSPDEVTYRNQLTDDELEMEQIELQLAETVKLNGTITPRDKYDDGLNLYYVNYDETLTIELSHEEWDSLVMAKIEEVVKLIENDSLGKFNMDELEVYTEYKNEYPHSLAVIPYDDIDVTTKQIFADFVIKNDKSVYLSSLTFDNFDSEYGEGTSTEENIADDIRSCTPNFSADSLDFGSETTGDIFYRTFIEELTGHKLSEKHICVPVSRESFEEMKKHHLGEYDTAAPEEEYYTYFYYGQIDDFTAKYLSWSANKEGLGEIDNNIAVEGSYISLSGMLPSQVSYDADGIRAMRIAEMYDVDDIYKESVPVVDINEILKKATKYMEGNYSSKSIEIINIELCYGQNITDGTDGPVKRIWSPFWVVEHAVRPVYTTTCETVYIMYDAITGERITYAYGHVDE